MIKCTDTEDMSMTAEAPTRVSGVRTKSPAEGLNASPMAIDTRASFGWEANTALASTGLAMASSMRASTLTTPWMEKVVTDSRTVGLTVGSGLQATWRARMEEWSGL